MSSTTISRAALVDSTGPGTGDIWNAALVGTAIYDKIDALFTAAQSVEYAVSGVALNMRVAHLSNTASSDALVDIVTAGASGGDPYIRMIVTSAHNWAFGIDNSDGDAFKFSCDSPIGGAGDHVRISTNGHFGLYEVSFNPSTADLAANAAVAIYNKSDTFVIAYNNAGVITYLKILLNGSATTWTHNTTAP